MVSRQTVSSKGINSYYISRGTILNGVDDDGDLWRGAIITGVGESTENDMDLHADGEGVAGVVIDFNDPLALDLDTANTTAGENLQYALRGSGALLYTFHDANAADALVIGAQATASTSVAGYGDLGTDIVVDHLGMWWETLTCVTSTYYLAKVQI
jgi:hypothetical protein